jgi:DNA-binding SARP family transcriptional activator
MTVSLPGGLDRGYAVLDVVDPVGAASEGVVRFGVLGPLQVVTGTEARAVSAAKQRIVLAALLLAAGRTVSAESLAEALWDASPPRNAAAVMRNYVMRLRRALGPVGGRIVGQPSGLAIELRCLGELDLIEVDYLARAAWAAAEAGEWRRVSSLLTRALRLWRGDPLVDVPSAALARRESARFTELRLQLIESRIDADLRLGRHKELVADLRRLVAEHPLREHIRAQLMSACYHCGLQAEALQIYRDARETLVSELGVEPGRELREMHRRILTADPDVTAIPPARVTVHAIRTHHQVTTQPLDGDERAQLARLRTENARLASELDVLKRASHVQLP